MAAPRFLKLLSMRTVLVGSMWLSLGLAAFLARPNVFVLVAGAAPFVFFNPTVNAMIIGYRVAVVAGVLLGSFSARATVTVLLAGFVVLSVITTASRSIRAAPPFDEVTGATAT